MFKDFLIERNLIVEMSTICHANHNYGFVAKIHSNDHNPPHFHVETVDGRRVAKIAITADKPEDINDFKIVEMFDTQLYNKIKQNILKWSKSKRKGIDVWDYAKLVWEDYHPGDKIDFQ